MNERTLFGDIDCIVNGLQDMQLEDVCRLMSFVPFERFGSHRHRRIEINFVKKGCCIIQLEEEELLNFRENEIMIICSEVVHSFQAGAEGCTLVQLEFLPDLFSTFGCQALWADANAHISTVFSPTSRTIKVVNNPRIVRSMQRIVNELNTYAVYQEHVVVLYYAELVLLIHRHLNEIYTPICSNRFLNFAVNFIRNHFNEDISINRVSILAGVSERYLRKLFHRHLNTSPIDFLNEVRINKAIEMLRLTECSIKEACFRCGFHSPQYFSRLFKKEVGVSPREFVQENSGRKKKKEDASPSLIFSKRDIGL